jgi:hypothetical protein
MKLPSLFGSAVLIGLISTGVLAAEAISGANVRSGPGTAYHVVDTLDAGQNVTVTECAENGWCMINHSGADGWVSASLLADNGNEADYYNAPGGRVQVADDFEDDGPVLIGRAPDVNVRFGFGFGNGSRFFGLGDRYIIGRPGRDRGDLVCLVTFFSRDDVAAGRDADVQRAQALPRRVAERRDGPNDRRSIFDYGSDRETIRTCRYLDRLN